mmetsp:Transcript_91922/g.263278  ORF Transcript_91922/g.263278 Transcript_91922/m.263278 type:complete len:250 (+) Transcript_91922:289-1038(+)
MQNQRMSNVRCGRNGCTALRYELLNVIHDGAANIASKPKIAKNAQEHTAVQTVAGSTSNIFLQSRRAQQTKVQGKQISQLRPLFGIVSKLSTKKSGAATAGQHTSQTEASRIESTTAKSTDNKQGMQVEPAHKHWCAHATTRFANVKRWWMTFLMAGKEARRDPKSAAAGTLEKLWAPSQNPAQMIASIASWRGAREAIRHSSGWFVHGLITTISHMLSRTSSRPSLTEQAMLPMLVLMSWTCGTEGNS